MKNELIIAIVNKGFSEDVMDVAREIGTSGGTIINARGTANKETEEKFNIVIEPQKEMVLIIVPSEKKDDMMKAIYKKVGICTPGNGIIFSCPVDETAGIKQND